MENWYRNQGKAKEGVKWKAIFSQGSKIYTQVHEKLAEKLGKKVKERVKWKVRKPKGGERKIKIKMEKEIEKGKKGGGGEPPLKGRR